GSLSLITATETAGQQRSWIGVAAHLDTLSVTGLSQFTLEARSLDLLYNGPDKTTGARLNWAGITPATLNGWANTPGTTFSDAIGKVTSTTDLSVSGSLYINVSGFIIGLGTFNVTQQAGIAVDDGSIKLTNASELLLRLSSVSLFVGMGGA